SDLTVYSSYSQGFRSGAPQGVGVPRDVPSVKPDKLNNYELGAKGDFLDKRLSVDAAVYYIKWNDVQQVLTIPYVHNGVAVGSVAALVNGESASGAGVDIAVTTRPLDRLELGVTFGWNDLKMDAEVFSNGALLFAKGDRLNYSPEFTGGTSVAYSF